MMENNKNKTGTSDTPLFGTSSDDIIEGLHNGSFIDPDPAVAGLDGDKELIVNEQEQNLIVNPDEEVFDEVPTVIADTTTPETTNAETAQREAEKTGTDLETDGIPAVKKGMPDDEASKKNQPKL
jgi:hypothetical protein